MFGNAPVSIRSFKTKKAGNFARLPTLERYLVVEIASVTTAAARASSAAAII